MNYESYIQSLKDARTKAQSFVSGQSFRKPAMALIAVTMLSLSGGIGNMAYAQNVDHNTNTIQHQQQHSWKIGSSALAVKELSKSSGYAETVKNYLRGGGTESYITAGKTLEKIQVIVDKSEQFRENYKMFSAEHSKAAKELKEMFKRIEADTNMSAKEFTQFVNNHYPRAIAVLDSVIPAKSSHQQSAETVLVKNDTNDLKNFVVSGDMLHDISKRLQVHISPNDKGSNNWVGEVLAKSMSDINTASGKTVYAAENIEQVRRGKAIETCKAISGYLHDSFKDDNGGSIIAIKTPKGVKMAISYVDQNNKISVAEYGPDGTIKILAHDQWYKQNRGNKMSGASLDSLADSTAVAELMSNRMVSIMQNNLGM